MNNSPNKTLTCLIIVVAMSGVAVAHPHHVCIAEMELVADPEPKLEVAILARAVDLGKAITQDGKQSLAPGSTSGRELDKRIVGYLEKHFIERAQDGSRLPMTWVGKELHDKTRRGDYWLYVSLQPRGRPTQLTVSNTLFMDLEPDQTNILTVKHQSTVRAIRFTRDEPQRPVPLELTRRPSPPESLPQ